MTTMTRPDDRWPADPDRDPQDPNGNEFMVSIDLSSSYAELGRDGLCHLDEMVERERAQAHRRCAIPPPAGVMAFRPDMIPMEQALRMRDCAVAEAVKETHPETDKAVRGSPINRWLWRWRESFPEYSPEYKVIDDMLEDYREHADTGTSLNSPIQYTGSTHEDGNEE